MPVLHYPDVTGIVLAGGRSRRMGRDKAFLDVGGRPMIQRVVDALRAVCGEVLVVTKTPAAYRGLEARLVEDQDHKHAALIGLGSGLRAAVTPRAFVAACDLPFLSSAVVAWMCGLASDVDAVVPCVDGRWHPLHAVYARALLPVFEARLRSGALALTEVFQDLRVRAVTAGDISVLDPDLDTIRNVNTEAEYRAAVARLAPGG
jgi:molybdopterin-guanine dinucleotide biosynthesis protein A